MSKTILVVEDNEDNSLLEKKILEHYGYKIALAETGKAALEYCKKNPPPSLILLDISLPDIDGYDLAPQIKKIAAFTYIPIIAVTAHSTKEMEDKILKAGCVNSLFKPFTPSELVKIVQQYIGKA